jgi:hypothetical protein
MNWKIISFCLVLLYLLTVLGLTIYYFDFIFVHLPSSYSNYKLLLTCTAVSLMGGVLYCLRATYINFCVKDQWSYKWIPWYIIRPIVSFLSGAACYIFLRAGLMILDAKVETTDNNLGFYSLAFIAGLNVDKFLLKIEEVAETTWGIAKSRASTEKENKE